MHTLTGGLRAVGLIYKLLVPRPVKRVRRTVTRATHPVRTVRRAATPRAVSAAAHPIGYTKGAVENQIVRSVKRRRGQSRRASAAIPAGFGAVLMLVILIGDPVLSVYAAIKDGSVGELFAGLLLGFVLLGVVASKTQPTVNRSR